MRFGCLTSNGFIQKQNKRTFVHKAHFQALDLESFYDPNAGKRISLFCFTPSVLPWPMKEMLWKMNENVAKRWWSLFHVHLKPVQACLLVAINVPTTHSIPPFALSPGSVAVQWNESEFWCLLSLSQVTLSLDFYPEIAAWLRNAYTQARRCQHGSQGKNPSSMTV